MGFIPKTTRALWMKNKTIIKDTIANIAAPVNSSH
jgi:hypothetical protein